LRAARAKKFKSETKTWNNYKNIKENIGGYMFKITTLSTNFSLKDYQ